MTSSINRYQKYESGSDLEYEFASEDDILRNKYLFSCVNFSAELGVYLLKKLSDVSLIRMRRVSFLWRDLIDSHSFLVARIAFKYFTFRANKLLLLHLNNEKIFCLSVINYTNLAELDPTYYLRAKTMLIKYLEEDKSSYMNKAILKLMKIEVGNKNETAYMESFKLLNTVNKIKACKKFSIFPYEQIKKAIFQQNLEAYYSVPQATSFFLNKGNLDDALSLQEKYPKNPDCIIKILKKYPYHLNDDKTNESFDQKLVQTIQNLYQKIIGFNYVPIDFHIQNLQAIAKHNPKRAEKEALKLLERKIDFSLEGPICVVRAENTELKIYFRSEDRAKIIGFIAELNPKMGLTMLQDLLNIVSSEQDQALILKVQLEIAKITKDFSTLNIPRLLWNTEIYKQLIIHSPTIAFKILNSFKDHDYNDGLKEIAFVLKNEQALKQIFEIPNCGSVHDFLKFFELNKDLNYLMQNFKRLEEAEYGKPEAEHYIEGAKLAKVVLDMYNKTNIVID